MGALPKKTHKPVAKIRMPVSKAYAPSAKTDMPIADINALSFLRNERLSEIGATKSITVTRSAKPVIGLR